MTREDKQLLLEDLCARLPYGVVCRFTDTFDGCEVDNVLHPDDITDMFRHRSHCDSRIDVKPYLRPLSSMTEEEKREFQSFFPGSFGGQWLNLEEGYIDIYECESTTRLYLYDSIRLIEWLNKKMFDYRGLIPGGLANEAPEGMYK